MIKDLEEALNQADLQFQKSKKWMQGKKINSDIKIRIIASYVLIALHHFDAIIKLIRIDNKISASALIRPNYEALLRATWLSINTDKTKVKKTIDKLIKDKGNAFPEFSKMTNCIDNAIGTDFFKNIPIKAFHNYTHGGFHMISRCINENSIAPSFTDEEIIGLLQGISVNTLMTILAYAYTVGDKKLAENCNNEIKIICDRAQ